MEQTKQPDKTKIDRKNVVIAAIALALVAIPVAVGSVIIVANSGNTDEKNISVIDRNQAEVVDDTAPDNSSVEVVGDDTDTTTPANNTEQNNQQSSATTRSFTLSSYVDTYGFSLRIPTDVDVEELPSGEAGGGSGVVILSGSDFEIRFETEVDYQQLEFNEFVDVENSVLPGLFRYQTDNYFPSGEDESITYFGYSNSPSPETDQCFQFGDPIENPCGHPVIRNSRNENLDWVRVYCSGDVNACDQIMASFRYE